MLALAVSASAQFPGGMTPPPQRYNTALLMNPQVQKDMHLSPEVGQKAMNVMMTVGMKAAPALMGMMSGKKMSAAEEAKASKDLLTMNEEMQSQTLKLLTPPQRVRLHEITLQQAGAAAFSDPELCREVGLTPKQSSSIQSVLAKISRRTMSELSGGKGFAGMMGGSSGKPDMAAIQGMQQRAVAAQKKAKQDSEVAVNAILTPVQKAKYTRLKGRPLPLKGSMGMGGMFGGM